MQVKKWLKPRKQQEVQEPVKASSEFNGFSKSANSLGELMAAMSDHMEETPVQQQKFMKTQQLFKKQSLESQEGGLRLR
jgi:hypothetical protein